MLPRATETEIGPIAVVSCPKVNFQPQRAKQACTDCEYFDGLTIMAPEGETWSQVYAIRCTHPMERRTVHLAVPGD